MRVERTKQAASRRGGNTPREPMLPFVEEDAGGRALVVVETETAETPVAPTSYREAEFLAHLIATKNQLPQTRVRRRAEPAEAIAAYNTADTLTERH